MKKKIYITDPLSVGVAHPLKIHMNDTLAAGTCFFYLHGERLFMITAGHNVTGKNAETGDVLGIPEKISVMLYIKNKSIKVWETPEIHLFKNNNPIWLTHPEHGEKVDVVAIPADFVEDKHVVKPINKINLENDIPINVGMEVFVLGYPHLYCSYPTLAPIWKRGSLATEPSINLDNMPKMYIDTATANGMSGAPIIAKTTNYYPANCEEDISKFSFGVGRCFLGIYTGRYTDKETTNIESNIFNAQLGIAWKKSVIEEIIELNGAKK